MSEKIIRDPVHDVIAFDLDRPLDRLLFALLNAVEFQRLRRIRQLGMAHLAYPGADHSRYSHSLGVMQTARNILHQLRDNTRIDPDQEALCLVGALLHDLGHGPFSHVFERVSGIHHERLTQRVILDPESEVHRILIQHDTTFPERLVDFLNCKPRRTFYCDILSSQLDADRFDYLLRDNLMTGSGYGDYDLTWLLHALVVDAQADRLAVQWKGVSAVEAYLQARYHMYRNVYFHKVVRSAEGMVSLALQRAKRLAVQHRLEWSKRETSVQTALLGSRMSMQEFVELDDVSVMHCFKLWMHSDDRVLASLCHGLLFRRAFKSIDLSHLDREHARKIAAVAERAIAQQATDARYEVFFDEPEDTPYERNFDSSDTGEEILVRDYRSVLTPLARVSPMTKVLNQQLMFRRLHFAEQWKPIVQKIVDKELPSS